MQKEKKSEIKNYASEYKLITKIFKKYLSNQKLDLFFAFLCMFFVAITTAVNAWLMQPVLDDIFFMKDMNKLLIIPVFVLVNSFFKGLAQFYQASRMKIIGQKISTGIQLDLYSHLIRSDITMFDRYPSGNLLSRFTNDINILRKSLSDILNGIICEILTFVGLVFIMFYQSINLALISILVFPIAIYPMIKLGRRMRKIARSMQEGLSDVTVRLDETFQNIRVIKSYGREDYEIRRGASAMNKLMDFYRKAAYIESASSPIMEVVGSCAIALVIGYGGYQVINGQTTPGSFFSFITALLMLYKPLKAISQLNNSSQEGINVAKRLFAILDEKPTIHDLNGEYVKFKNYDISFVNVSFSYNESSKILDSLNIFVPEGKTVALVGTSGVGKTTILNLLQRFYDPTHGQIMIGGYDIKNIKLKNIRDAIALVSQDVTLFDDTVFENIRYGKLDSSKRDIVYAAEAAAADEFIDSFQDKYNTYVGQNGVKLSGGQKQRIAIARAILKNAPILLLDEATSALDGVSEKKIQEALENLKRGRTTIIIAHRLSTIENADIIYLVGEGGIIEFGNHQDLLDKKGEYYSFYNHYKDKIDLN